MTTNTTFRTLLAAVTLVAIAFAFLTPTACATVVRLTQGMEIKVKFAGEDLSSGKLAKDDTVQIALAEPVVVDDSTIVPAGAVGRAVVTAAEKNGRGGKPGFIKAQFVSLIPAGAFKSKDGSAIKLAGEYEHKGKGKKTLSYIFIFGLFIKGGNGQLDTNTIHTATIAETIKLESE